MFLIFVFSTTKLVNILTSCKSAEGNERVRHQGDTLYLTILLILNIVREPRIS